MLPIILTDTTKRILCIGGGSAIAIKLKMLTTIYKDITVIANDHSKISEYDVAKITRDFWDISIDEMMMYDMIYLGLPYQEDDKYIDIINKLKQSRLVCVLGNHILGNFIHPCTRYKDDIIVSVSTGGKSPKRACQLAQKIVDTI